MKANAITAMVAGAGLFAGAIAWGVHQEAAFGIASYLCGGEAGIWIAGTVALAVLALGTLLSWLAFRGLVAGQAIGAQEPFRARRFLATVSLMAGLIFLFAILLQGAAVFFLPACAA